jgi:glycosyltransferase involved in cell wall biosynthesis
MTPHKRPLFLLSHGFQTEYEVGFANGVARNGIAVTLIAADNTLYSRLDAGIRALNLRGSQRSDRSSLSKARNLARYFCSYSALGLRHRDAIFHFCGLFTLRRGVGVLVEALLARMVFKTWWLTVHNLLPHDDHRKRTEVLFGLVYRLPDHLFVHTHKLKTQLVQRFKLPEEKITVIDHGIDRFIQANATAKVRITEAFGLPPHKTLLLMFGNLSPYKGVEDLLEALESVALPEGVALLIAGKPNSAALRDGLMTRLGMHPNAKQIRLHLDYVDEDLIQPLLSAADVMILPYRHIDQSGVLFSAKSAGLPCILTDVGSFSEYMDPDKDILIPPRDRRALSEAILRFCQEPSSNHRERAVAAAESRYSWKLTLQPYVQLLAS